MDRKIRKSLFLAIAAITLTSSLAACSGSGGNKGNSAASPSESAATSPSASPSESAAPSNALPPMPEGKYDPPIEITTVAQVGPEQKYRDGESLDDNVFTRWLRDEFGIVKKTMWTTPTTNDAYKTKLMLTLSANEPMPDYLNVPYEIAFTLIDSGKFRAVDDLFEEYASDKWKAAMAETENVWLPYMREGKAYGIPMIEASLLHDDVMWIRQDWLDKLGLKAPTTTAELEAVMDAFVNRDPDGNGEKDTIAIAAAAKVIEYNKVTWLGLNPLLGAFGSFMNIWTLDAQGQPVYGSTTPETKTALGKIKEYVDKGYLHKEIGIHDEIKAIELFNSGKAGIAFAASWAYDWPFNEVEKTIEGAKVLPYPLPAGPDGKIGQVGNGLNHWLVLLINKDMKNPEALFKYQNYMYENFEDPAAGSKFENGFAEGYDYAFVDGKLVTSDAEIPGGRAAPPFLMMPPTVPSKNMKTRAALADGKEPVTPFEKKVSASPQASLLAAKHVVAQAEYSVNNMYMGPLTQGMKDKQENLNKMEAEMFSKIIYGKEPLDYFDEWVADWKSAGGDQIQGELAEWYAMVTAK